MTSLWLTAAGVAALWWAGSAAADLGIYSDRENFTAYADSQDGFPSQTFRSSDIVAPVFQVNSWDRAHADAAPYLFLGTVYGHMKAGPMIFDAGDLSLVYADQRYDNTYCSNVQVIGGTRYMIFWEGVHNRGHASGHCLVYDENYRLRYNVTAQGLHGRALADMHEMMFTPDETIVFSTYFNIPYDCRAVGGPEEALLMDSGFQEVDPETNKVLFEWNASDHFDIADSFARYDEVYGVTPDSGFDFFHINSIEKTSDGNYLVSSRHLSALTLVDGKDGHPIWILGGKRNQFEDLSNGTATNFGWQHDARFYHNQSHITMFDNHGEVTGNCEGECESRGLHLEIDSVGMTARVVREYFHPESINSGAMGGLQQLESGNVMIGWGYSPGFVEYKSDGTPVMDVQRGKIGVESLADMFAYRVYKHQWKGKPTWPPSAAVDAPSRTTLNATVYLSWNGATDVKSWAVLAAGNATAINNYRNLIAEAPRRGFETAIHLGANATRRYIGAAALAADGTVLGSTSVIDMESGLPVATASDITSIRAPRKARLGATRIQVGGATRIRMAGAIFALAVVVYAANHRVWRRKARRDTERAMYTEIGMAG
ncbi:Uncharacterized protein TCAP_00293 [Tolypocladium capitatum]|uniref:Arylsulfotransferase n=1 Tax=Tolypocladium capitatum TaxID=45235 RepID=A0A2K3QQH2_9HYPO|nr:Uncharacterized protein TCAP_00293 [Tolypocladium capitatum]